LSFLQEYSNTAHKKAFVGLVGSCFHQNQATFANTYTVHSYIRDTCA